MNLKRTYLWPLCLLPLTAEVNAAAFQLAEQNVSGLGRAYAGEASSAEDASVVARNPALMSKFTQPQLTVMAIYVDPNIDLEGQGSNVPGIPAEALSYQDIASSAIIPAAFYVRPMNDKWSFGVGMFSNFGLETAFDDDYVAGSIAGETGIITINTSLTAAYQVSPKLSVAVGANHIYADAKIVRRVGANPFTLPESTLALSLKGDDTGFGWNLGLAYQPSRGHQLGLTYRSRTELTFAGDFTNELPSSVGGLNGQVLPGQLALTLPAMAEFSGSHHFTEQSRFHYSVMWNQWNVFQSLEAFVAGNSVFKKEVKSSNAWRYAIGMDTQINPRFRLRLGLAYDEEPANPTKRSISIPDTNRVWYTLGGHYKIDASRSLDVGVAAVVGQSQRFSESPPGSPQSFSYESDGVAYLFGLQYNHSF